MNEWIEGNLNGTVIGISSIITLRYEFIFNQVIILKIQYCNTLAVITLEHPVYVIVYL